MSQIGGESDFFLQGYKRLLYRIGGINANSKMSLWRKRINFLGDVVNDMQPFMVCISWMILRHISDGQRDELRDIGLSSKITSITVTPEVRMYDIFWEVDRVPGTVERLYAKITKENKIESIKELVSLMYASLFRKRPNMVCEGEEDDEQTMTTDNENNDHDNIFDEEEEQKQTTTKKKRNSEQMKRLSLEEETINMLQSMENKRRKMFATPPPLDELDETSNLEVEENYEVCLTPTGNVVSVENFCEAVHTFHILGADTPMCVFVKKNNVLYQKDVSVGRLVKYLDAKTEYELAKKRVDELRFMAL